MSHLLLARCHPDDPRVAALVAAFDALRVDPREPRVSRLSLLDLSVGPTVGRVRAAIGLGWQARDRLRRVARGAGVVDLVVEACLCGRHHLLGLGRAGVPSARWVPRATGEWVWSDRQAAAEGTAVYPATGGAVDADRVALDLLDLLVAQHGITPAASTGKR